MTDVDGNKIVSKLSNEIVDEIKKSNQKVTEKELKSKIDLKIKQIIEKKKLQEEAKKQAQFAKDEKFIEEEFTNIKNVIDEDNEEDNEKDQKYETKNNDIKNEVNNIDEVEDNEELNNINKDNDTEKKPFFLEITDLYKEEYNKSINGFKNFINSFEVIKNASLFEKIFLSLFIIIPALLSGFVGLLLLLIVLVFWQISIIFKAILRSFKKVETFFYDNMKKIKATITSFKNSGGLFKRLIFSNFLYSILCLNGLFYLLMKGMMIPISSLDKLNKILGNLATKTTRGISNVLKSPSELALSSIKNNALSASHSNSINGFSNSISGSGRGLRTGLGRFTKNRMRNQAKRRFAKDLQRERAKYNSKSAYMDGRYISEDIFNTKNTTTENKNTQNINEDIKTRGEENQERLRDLVFDTENQRRPFSYNLSDRAMEDLMMSNITDDILNHIKNNFKDIIDDKPIRDIQPEIPLNNNMSKITDDLKTETQEKIDNINSAQNNLNSLGYQDPISLSSQYKDMRDNGVEYPVTETLKAQNQNWDQLSQDDKIRAAINVGDIRAGQEDLRDLHHYNEWTKDEGKNISYESYLSTKLENAQRDCQQESSEFKERYGHDCEQLIQQSMKENNIPLEKSMNNQEFEKVAMDIVKKFPEEKQVEMAKDLREYNLTYVEVQNCKKDLQREKQISTEKTETEKNDEKREVTEKINHSMKSFVDMVEERRQNNNIENKQEKSNGQKSEGRTM